MRIKGIPFAAVPGLLGTPRISFDCPLHIFIAICDHYEPMTWNPARHVQDARVERWLWGYPQMAAGLEDSTGRAPQHTFFYPADEYVAEHVEQIAGLCRAGYGDIEVHLHHHNDTSESLREKLETYVHTLSARHGMLERDATGRLTYGFIHGNWALDNSHPTGEWCGVNDELTILRQTGCYADFTMPSAPDGCQTTTVNSLYYAIDDPLRPKSHDRGIPAQVGKPPPADSLLLIQGPLVADWSNRKLGIVPRIENGDLLGQRPATMGRFKLWCRAAVSVIGRPDWLFVKLHTHGAQEKNAEMLLGEPMRRFHDDLKDFARLHPALRYYYVTAREMVGLVRQAESGQALPQPGATRSAPGSVIPGSARCTAPADLAFPAPVRDRE